MRRAPNLDGNHAAVVRALTNAGMRVFSLAGVGKGCPDVMVGWREITCLLEIKDGAQKPSRRALTVDEQKFHEEWSGHLAIVESPDEAVQAVVEHAKKCGVL